MTRSNIRLAHRSSAARPGASIPSSFVSNTCDIAADRSGSSGGQQAPPVGPVLLEHAGRRRTSQRTERATGGSRVTQTRLARDLLLETRMNTTTNMLETIRPRLLRLARAMSRRYRGLIEPDEIQGLVELGALEAWRQRRLEDPRELGPYAVVYARGRVLEHVRKELRHRDTELLRSARVHGPAPADPETKAEARRLLERLSAHERAVLIRHACGRDSLAQLARESNRHRAWGSRTLASAYAQLRDSPSPPGSHHR